MKKKLLLLTTFLISFVMFSSSALADEYPELDCVYEVNKVDQPGNSYIERINIYGRGLTQSSTGEISYYNYISKGSSVSDISEYKYEKIEKPKLKKPEETTAYDSKTQKFKSCPECAYSGDTSTLKFADKENDGKCPKNYKPLVPEKKVANNSCHENTKEELDSITGINWTTVCHYTNKDNDVKYNTTLYMNDEKFVIKLDNESKEVTTCISNSELKRGTCPEIYYKTIVHDKIEYYANNSVTGADKMLLKESNGEYISDYENNGEKVEVSNCEQLLNDDLIKEINKIMNLIRIIVPILLLVFGITDFFRATFANADDDVKKSRDRFIKRIIAAIIVFIVPYFVNLVLNLTNKVWSDINPETCIDSEQ